MSRIYASIVLVMMAGPTRVAWGQSRGEAANPPAGLNAGMPVVIAAPRAEENGATKTDGPMSDSDDESAEWIRDQEVVTPELFRLESDAQSGVRCGPNALYMLLALRGRRTDYNTVLSRVHLTEKGTSLLDLKRVSGELGVPCEVLKLDVDELRDYPKPLIVHLNGTPSWKEVARDHFAVIIGTTPRGFRIFDSLNAKVVDVDSGFIARNFSGYMLAPVNTKSITNLINTKSITNLTLILLSFILTTVNLRVHRKVKK